MICIKNGTLHTAVSREPIKADLLIDNGKIVRIAENINEAGAEVIDAAGLNVYPGFVEAHCHIGLDGYGIGYEGQVLMAQNPLRAVLSQNRLSLSLEVAF